jgi:hypothetical protein
MGRDVQGPDGLRKEIAMRKRWILALLLVFSCAAAVGKEPKPLPMPPLVSHGQPISNYACVFNEASQVAMVDYWNVMAFAEYGSEHKRYWSKSLGTFRGSEAVTSHNAESAGSGAVVGMVVTNSRSADGEKKCAEWKEAVHEMISKSHSK